MENAGGYPGDRDTINAHSDGSKPWHGFLEILLGGEWGREVEEMLSTFLY